VDKAETLSVKMSLVAKCWTSLMAAGRTVEKDRMAHSLHGYFLRAGDTTAPIIYEVDRLRDGKSFINRQVTAIQHGQPIFVCSASFTSYEEGLDHQSTYA
jgi:acyl-CoA thioesterase-2